MTRGSAVLEDRVIGFHRLYVDIAGSITAALMLSQAVYWSPKARHDGWFYKTQAEWSEETGLTRREQESARKRLKQIGVLEEDRRGVPAQLWYHVDRELLDKLVDDILDARECADKDGGKRQSGEAENAKHTIDTDYPTDDTKEQDDSDDAVPAEPKRKRIAYPPAFEAFWQAYPKGHGTKKLAYAEWQKFDPDEPMIGEIMAGLEEWKRCERWKNGFIRDAERFLKHEMWENQPPPPDKVGDTRRRNGDGPRNGPPADDPRYYGTAGLKRWREEQQRGDAQ